MRITTLGTSHGDPTYCRFNSSNLIEIGEVHYLIDAGAPVDALLVRADKDFARIKAVFVTHMHGDHVAGITTLIKMLLKYPKEGQHTDIFFPEAKAYPALGAWLKAMHLKWPSPLISTNVSKPGQVYADDRVTVSAVPTRHMENAGNVFSCGYIIETEGKRAIFTGDLKGDFSDFPEIIREEPFDLCFCEMTHFQPEAALPILMDCPIHRLVFTHIHNPWHGDGERTLREILSPLPYPFDIAHDGDVFELPPSTKGTDA
ncbi:MAG: ribonuclease Z [Planctomycetes bacterium]|nr:ribonuclease Z [Planctomycetota bacterium]